MLSRSTLCALRPGKGLIGLARFCRCDLGGHSRTDRLDVNVFKMSLPIYSPQCLVVKRNTFWTAPSLAFSDSVRTSPVMELCHERSWRTCRPACNRTTYNPQKRRWIVLQLSGRKCQFSQGSCQLYIPQV